MVLEYHQPAVQVDGSLYVRVEARCTQVRGWASKEFSVAKTGVAYKEHAYLEFAG